LGGYGAYVRGPPARAGIAGLVLANTRAGADAPEGAAGRRALAERLLSEGNVLADAPPPLLAEDAPPELQEQVRGWIAEQEPAAIAAAALGMAERPDSSPDLAGIDVPTLVVTSDGDRLIPADATSPLAQEIRGATLEVLPGAGHLTNLEAPVRFTELLRAHLRRCGVTG
jgi:pimeloyl-ACP methyl ester carboxylesterase